MLLRMGEGYQQFMQLQSNHSLIVLRTPYTSININLISCKQCSSHVIQTKLGQLKIKDME